MSQLLLTRIDALLRDDHFYLGDDDECYALREYTSREGYSYSESNGLVSNLKKAMDRKGRPEWYWKEKAIEQAGRELQATTNAAWRATVTIVPMPPSRAKTDPLYDDRLLQIAQVIVRGTTGQVRELLHLKGSVPSFHTTDGRRDIEQLRAAMCIDEAYATPPPQQIAILDDVLTTGAHFIVAKALLARRFPGANVVGLFWTRRVFAPKEPAEPDDMHGDDAH